MNDVMLVEFVLAAVKLGVLVAFFWVGIVAWAVCRDLRQARPRDDMGIGELHPDDLPDVAVRYFGRAADDWEPLGFRVHSLIREPLPNERGHQFHLFMVRDDGEPIVADVTLLWLTRLAHPLRRATELTTVFANGPIVVTQTCDADEPVPAAPDQLRLTDVGAADLLATHRQRLAADYPARDTTDPLAPSPRVALIHDNRRLFARLQAMGWLKPAEPEDQPNPAWDDLDIGGDNGCYRWTVRGIVGVTIRFMLARWRLAATRRATRRLLQATQRP